MFYILDFIFYRAAEIYARFGLGPVGPKKFYTGASPDCFVSFPIYGITLFIPLNIYKFTFRYILDVEAFIIGILITFTLYFLLINIIFDRRYKDISFDTLRLKYKSSKLDKYVPDFVIILVPIVLWIGGTLFAFYTIIGIKITTNRRC